jgi:hypothetical protein
MADEDDEQRRDRDVEASLQATEDREGERSERMSDDEMREHNRQVDAEGRDDSGRADRDDGGAERARREDLPHAERAMPPDDPEKTPDDGHGTLIARDPSDAFQERWSEIQARFVDDPRDAVKDASQLVGEVVDCITRTFDDERSRLERHWKEGGDAGTEELRVALQRYRSFFQRLLDTAA